MDTQTLRVQLFAAAVAMVTALGLVGLLALVLAKRGKRPISSWERRIAWGSLWSLATGVLCVLYGLFIEADWVEVTRVRIETPKLPAGMSLRLVHLSDLHVDGPTRALDKLPALVNAEKPHLVVFTGDTLNSERGLALARKLFEELEAPRGVYAVRGNHDVWYWQHLDLFGDGVAHELRGAEPLPLLGGALALCGATYGVTGHLEECLRRAGSTFKLVAYHTPDLVEDLAGHADAAVRPDLYLAGHTHGGQVRLPFYGALVTLSKFDKKYEAGRYQVGDTTLYVSRGIGFEPSGPRARFLTRPEVTVIDLEGTGETTSAAAAEPNTTALLEPRDVTDADGKVLTRVFAFPSEPTKPDLPSLADFLNPRSQSVVRNATEVELIRLQGRGPAGSPGASRTRLAACGDPNLAGFAIERRQLLTDSGFAARLQEQVLSLASYGELGVHKLCGGFQPKVVFRFRRGDQRVDVLLCFNCKEVGVIGAGQKRAGPDDPFAILDMRQAKAWLALAKEALPADRFIQGTTLGP